jgi:hypothetical protein
LRQHCMYMIGLESYREHATPPGWSHEEPKKSGRLRLVGQDIRPGVPALCAALAQLEPGVSKHCG